MLHQLILIMLVLWAPNHGPIVRAAAEGPVISDLRVTPSVGPAGTVYTLSLHIADPRGADHIVPVLYQLREGFEAIEMPLNDEGRAGDQTKGDGVYSGQSRVPDSAARLTHRFEVFIRDKEKRGSNVLVYQFTVLEGLKL